jgi:hypothetical protein
MQDVYVDISAIENKLGGQIAQIAFESAAPNGFANTRCLYFGETILVDSPAPPAASGRVRTVLQEVTTEAMRVNHPVPMQLISIYRKGYKELCLFVWCEAVFI